MNNNTIVIIIVILMVAGIGYSIFIDDVKEDINCEDYDYSSCPLGCVQNCVSSSCSDDGTCTDDCDGPRSCREI